MKIKYITNVRIPTSRAQGYAVMKMCEEFANSGAQVQLIVPNRRNNESESNPFTYYGISKNFKIRKVQSIDLLGPYEAFGKLFYWIDMLSFLFSLWVSKIVQEDDVIYTRDFLVPLVFSKNKFICLELHDIPKSKLFFNYLIHRPKLFFVLNTYIKESLTEVGIPESRIFIVPSGVDLEAFNISVNKEEARKQLLLPQDKKIMIYTGHFYKWKGVNTLAETAKLMPEALFVFVGGVDPELSKFKEEYKKYNNILVLPFQERKMMPFYLKASDVLVVPNSLESKISSKYTSPLKLFEYMASNRPIVASDLPSLREVLNEENCMFAKPDDPDSFAKALKKVLKDELVSKNMIKNASNDVLHYSWKNRAEKILSVISKVHEV